ncbi:MAG: WbuC family cupin fold metalloprotein [Bacteroidales bacterium]|nr:WbuC family cupin fold metalloprotein [Bacteroidales bacterium]
MKKIDTTLVGGIIQQSVQSSRKRRTYNFHKEASDTLHRMLNAMQPGTYVAPHKHETPDKREAFIIITGKIAVVEYDQQGNITDHIILDRERGNYGVEVQPGIWHSLIPLESNTVIYEVKDGPYDPETDKKFSPWAPAEGDPNDYDFSREVLKKLDISI